MLSIIFTSKINPVSVGLSYSQDPLVKKIETIDKINPGSWVVLESLPLENFPSMAGVNNFSGAMLYPQFSLWKEFPNYENYKDVINRYAHVSFGIVQEEKDNMRLVSPDFYTVFVNPCNDFAQKNIKYYISVKEVNSKCLTRLEDLNYYQTPIIIYQTTELTI